MPNRELPFAICYLPLAIGAARDRPQIVFSFCKRARIGTLAPMGITPLQFKQMQERLGNPRRAATPVFERTMPLSAGAHQIILGVDPSLRGTGYGVIRLAKPRPLALATAQFPARQTGSVPVASSKSWKPCAKS